MITVYCYDTYLYRIEHVLVFRKIYRNNRVAVLRSKADGSRTVSPMNGYQFGIQAFETDKFIARKRIADRTSLVSLGNGMLLNVRV